MSEPERIAYAPNGEDVVLWRALGHLTPGWYVDVGAHHPIDASVTKLFSLRGWRGINIEPLPHLADLLRADRPDDVTLCVAVSDTTGELDMFVADDDPQRTTLDAGLAEEYRRMGWRISRRVTPVVTLDDVLARHPLPRIDFLKIDAEGFEDAVIRGLDLTTHRPAVIVAEEGRHKGYEFPALLDAAGYEQRLWDGLNRFFVANERLAELGEAFAYGASIVDGWERADVAAAKADAALLWERCGRLQQHIDDIHRSATWRTGSSVLRPARALREVLRKGVGSLRGRLP